MLRHAILIVFCFLASGTLTEAKTLPRAEEPTGSKGCEWAGPGFAKLEGSDTCVRVGGNMRADFSASRKTGGAFTPWK